MNRQRSMRRQRYGTAKPPTIEEAAQHQREVWAKAWERTWQRIDLARRCEAASAFALGQKVPRKVTAPCSICKALVHVDQDDIDRMARWAALKKMPKRELWSAYCAGEHNHIYLRAVGP